MKLNATHIFSAVLAGIIIAQFLFYKCESSRKDKDIAALQKSLSDCRNAPVKTDTMILTQMVKDTIRLSKTYSVTDTIRIFKDTTLERRAYEGTYNHPQFELHWMADVTGEMHNLNIIPPSLIKSLIITKEKTINNSPEIVKVPVEKSHLYTNFGINMIGQHFGGADVNLMYIRKEGWGLSAGIGTDFEYLTYRAGLIIKLR